MRGSVAASPNGGSFPIKTMLQLQGNFTLANVPANPTTVALILTPPNAASRRYVAGMPIDGVGVVRSGVGVYALTFTPAVSGSWSGTWQGTGAVTATRDFSFSILPSSIISGQVRQSSGAPCLNSGR
jgi:hypothetical protein